MPQVLNIYDGGLQKIKGRNYAIIFFNITTNEGKPQILTGFCHPSYRDSVIKSLKRLSWETPGLPAGNVSEDQSQRES